MSQDKILYSSSLENSKEILYLDESFFNSKIFIHLADINESLLNNSYTKETDNTSESDEDVTDEKFIDDFLINELVEEINSPCLNIPKKKDKLNFLEEKTENEVKNFSDILLPLAKKGYEFLPKSFKLNRNKLNNVENNKKFELKPNNLNVNKNKKTEFQERKGDWRCALCNNLNFAFRTKCNRCQALKINQLPQNNKLFFLN